MQKMDIKDNVDNMVLQICKYIKASDLSEKEDTEIKLECAMTFLVASIDFTDKPIENVKYILEQHANIVAAIMDETSETIVDYIRGTIQEDRLLWF